MALAASLRRRAISLASISLANREMTLSLLFAGSLQICAYRDALKRLPCFPDCPQPMLGIKPPMLSVFACTAALRSDSDLTSCTFFLGDSSRSVGLSLGVGSLSLAFSSSFASHAVGERVRSLSRRGESEAGEMTPEAKALGTMAFGDNKVRDIT